jgi:hypothetical protein
MILILLLVIMILFSIIHTGINRDGLSACHTVIPIVHLDIGARMVILITLPGIAGRIMIPGIIRLMAVTGGDTILTCIVITMAIMMAIITEVAIPNHTITVPITMGPVRLLKTTGLPEPVAQEVSVGRMQALRVLQG